MMMKTNPLISFSEYDQFLGSNECQLLQKVETIRRELPESNANPFLVIPEYEPERSFNERRNNSNHWNSNHKRIAMKRERPQKQDQWSKFSIKAKQFENFNRNSSKHGKIEKNKQAKNCKQNVRPKDVWGIPKSASIPSSELISPPNLLSLEAAGGFDWNATAKDLAQVVSDVIENDTESEDSDGELPLKRKKITANEKRMRALQREKTLKMKEKELLEAEENPQSPDHFERLLIGSPNSSELWIKYMGYHAVNADIEKARVVARRGIKRINPEHTSSKLDVWIALLNLEHTFSPLETFKETFAEALKFNDDYAVNSRVLSLYKDSKNATEVDQLTNIMTKKYRYNVENWLQCQDALMTVGLVEKARNLLQKALTILTKKEHVTLISRFALLENKHGFPDQAQALFENLLTSFPQRLDLLYVYVDMLTKSELISLARSVLERAVSYTLPVRKMRSIYMKWIAFEEAHGKPSNVAFVEEAAKKYVTDILKPKDIDVKKDKGFVSIDSSVKLENTESLDDGSVEENEESD